MEYYFGRGNACTDKTSEKYISINNVGYYKEIDTTLRVSRANGRSDYQIIYIESGNGHFLIDGELTDIGEGNVVLYRPYERQIYSFEETSNASYCWVHFTGVGAEELLSELRLDGTVFRVGGATEIKSRIKKMIDACGVENFITNAYLTGELIALLAELAKNLYSFDLSIARVIDAMRRDSQNLLTNADYAKICGTSEYHFIRKFKKCVGVTPHRYKTTMTIEKAKDLLQKTELNVSETASLLGFEDSLYFSRAFKRETGVSPRDFMNSAKKAWAEQPQNL